MLKKEKLKKFDVNPYDENYAGLNCKIDSLEEKEKEYKMIDEYL